MENNKKVYEFYNNGAEIDRFEHGLGIVEFYRSKEIISRYITEKSVVYDIGGGIGKYAEWLAGLGHDVTMIELAPTAVEYAKQHMKTPYTAQVGDARRLEQPDERADIVLLMGPLYHLQNHADRVKALFEARRVLKRDGLLIAAGISRFSTATWALSKYSMENNFLDDDIYMDMIRRELLTGEHDRPEKYPFFIADAYFHTVDDLENEILESGFTIIDSVAVEGSVWIAPTLEEKWSIEDSRNRMLEIIRVTERERTIMGMSPHFLTIGRK